MPIIDSILLPNGIWVIDSTTMEFHARRTKKYTDTLIDGFYYVPGNFYRAAYTPEETKTSNCNDVADYFKYKGFGAIKISQDSLLVGGTVQGDMDYYCNGNLFDNTKFYLPIFQERIFKPGGELNIGINGKSNSFINNKVSPFYLTTTPNPVFSTATIQYTLGQTGRISIAIYDAMNNPVKSLLNATLAAGTYTIQWDGRYTNGRQAPTGLYTILAIVDGKKYAYRVQVLK